MNILKQSLKITLLISLLFLFSCKDKYPDLPDGLYAEFVTNKGVMVANLNYNKVPVTVANFVALAEGTHPKVTDSLKGKPYYNGLIFHRVIDNFMIQGGDPTGTGSGNPGYQFEDEFHPKLKHDKPGILSMANSGSNSNGSQFFITEKETPWLDNKHSVFGELVIGLNIQDTISNVKATKTKPDTDVVIEQLNIIRKGKEAKAFNAAKVFIEEQPKIAEKQKKYKEQALEELKDKSKLSAENFLKKNANAKGTVKKISSGIVMIHEENGGIKPTSQDKVLIDCTAYFEDGRIFYTTLKHVAESNNIYDQRAEDAGAYKPFPMIYNETARLVPGFREAMLNMNVGDKVRVFVPSYLGYGEAGRAPRVPPNTDLIFDLEIKGIVK